MAHTSAGLEAGLFSDNFRYERHRPERTLIYQLVEQYYPDLVDLMASQGKPLPSYVRREFEEYLKCGRLKHGFLRLRCDTCQAERLLAFSCTNSRRFRRTSWHLPQLRSATHGRKCGTIG